MGEELYIIIKDFSGLAFYGPIFSSNLSSHQRLNMCWPLLWGGPEGPQFADPPDDSDVNGKHHHLHGLCLIGVHSAGHCKRASLPFSEFSWVREPLSPLYRRGCWGSETPFTCSVCGRAEIWVQSIRPQSLSLSHSSLLLLLSATSPLSFPDRGMNYFRNTSEEGFHSSPSHSSTWKWHEPSQGPPSQA